MLRHNRPSVWEDRGSVADEGFRSLKQSAKESMPAPQPVFLPLFDDTSAHEPAGTMNPDDFVLPPKRPILPRFDSFMREKKHRSSQKVYGDVRKKKPQVPDRQSGNMSALARKLAEPSQPKWQPLAKSDHFFGGERSHGLGCDLARHEYDSRSTLNRYNNLKAVKDLMKAAKSKPDDAAPGDGEVSLPAVNAQGNRTAAKHGPGYIRMDYADEEGFNLFKLHLHKPARADRSSLDRSKVDAAMRRKKEHERELQADFEQMCARQAAAFNESREISKRGRTRV